MIKFANDQELCKALFYNSKDFLSEPDLQNPYEDILFKHIHPYRFIPGTEDTEKNYITMSFRNYRPVKGQFKSGLIVINVIVPRNPDVLRIDNGLRYDFILSKIDEIMNNSRDIGIGKLEFHAMDEFEVNEKYLGFFIAYKLVELN